MTIGEVLSEVRRLRPSEYEDAVLLRWLNEAEWTVYREIILTHEGAENIHFEGYTAATPQNTPLLAADGFEGLYKHYICARIDEANGEIGRYNNSAALYNSAYLTFMDWYNRNHMPLRKTAALRFT